MDELDACDAPETGGRVLNNAPRMKKNTPIRNAPSFPRFISQTAYKNKMPYKSMISSSQIVLYPQKGILL
jgi:hypothetical protein